MAASTANVIDASARAWVRRLSPAFNGQPVNALLTGNLGKEIMEQAKGPIKNGIALGNFLVPFLGDVVMPYGLWRCGLSIVANLELIRTGAIPASIETLRLPEKEKILVKIVRTTPGELRSGGWRLWETTFLLASSPLAGMELTLAIPDWSLLAMAPSKRGPAQRLLAFPEYTTGRWYRIVLTKRGNSYVIEHFDHAYKSVSKALNQYRVKCVNGPCHKCSQTQETCKYAVKSTKKGN